MLHEKKESSSQTSIEREFSASLRNEGKLPSR